MCITPGKETNLVGESIWERRESCPTEKQIHRTLSSGEDAPVSFSTVHLPVQAADAANTHFQS